MSFSSFAPKIMLLSSHRAGFGWLFTIMTGSSISKINQLQFSLVYKARYFKPSFRLRSLFKGTTAVPSFQHLDIHQIVYPYEFDVLYIQLHHEYLTFRKSLLWFLQIEAYSTWWKCQGFIQQATFSKRNLGLFVVFFF